MTEAQKILNRLHRMVRFLYPQYGTANIVFSDGSGVSRTDWAPGPLEEIEELLKAGEHPIGVVAPLRDSKGKPFIETWQEEDDEALVRLQEWTRFWWGHRIVEG